jgi:curved DNA-binding protein CbpA
MRGSEQWNEYASQLGLSPNASWEQIQGRFRQLVLELHPDVNSSPTAAERFRKVALAYEHLVELRRRRPLQSTEELAQMYDDPRIRRLSLSELGMRLHYSSSANVRSAAACLLGSIGSRESRRLLVATRRDPDETVRRIALDSLGKVGRLSDLVQFLPELNRDLATCFFRSAARICRRGVRKVLPWIQPGGGNSESTGQDQQGGQG